MGQSEAPKHKPQKHKKQMLVRYGRMGCLGWFDHNETDLNKTNPNVVIKTARGLEIGTLVGPYSYKSGQFKHSCKQVQDYYFNRTRDYPLAEGGTFVRFATEEDLMEAEHLDASSQEELKCCQQFVKELELDMKTVDAEHLFGGERIILYFTSNGRVDFRELVRKLAKEYQTRIEMRQIGSRDEARIISGFESCGQECCCSRFLKILEPVNMRMAKLQKATLDPSKISGHCGRLKCCLRYEDQTYKELKANLPKKNTNVKTAMGKGKVVDTQVLTQIVVVQFESGRREAFNLDDIEVMTAKDKPLQKGPAKTDRPERNRNAAKDDTAPEETEPEIAEETEEKNTEQIQDDKVTDSPDSSNDKPPQENRNKNKQGGDRKRKKRKNRRNNRKNNNR